MTSIQLEFQKPPGAYKGTRRRREPPIVAECPCGWRRKATNREKAEQCFAERVATMHAGTSGAPSPRSFAPALELRVLALNLLLVSPALAQNYPAAIGSGAVRNVNSQTFQSGGSFNLPAANQLITFFVSGPPGQTLSSISDTYGLGGACSGTPPVCGSWKQFSTSGLHSNSNQGFTNSLMTGNYAPTGTNSGAETITLTWSGSGTAQLFTVMSWSANDVNFSGGSPEDSSGFHEDTNANTCTSPSPVGPTLTISNAHDIVISLMNYNPTFDLPNLTTSSGPTQVTIIDSSRNTWANLPGWNGISGTPTTVPTGSNLELGRLCINGRQRRSLSGGFEG